MTWQQEAATWSRLRAAIPAPIASQPLPNPMAPKAPATNIPTSPATGTAPVGLSADQKSAQATIQVMLDQWGLGALGQWAWNKYLNGEPIDAIAYDVRNTDTYKQRFPGMALLQQKGQAITEAQYIAKETADAELFRAYGLQGYANRDTLGQLIGSQVSTTELQNRLEDRRLIVEQLPAQVRDYAQRQLGLNTGDLIGMWLDPKQAETQIRKKVAASEIGGAAALAGFNNLSPDVAAQLAGLRANGSGLVDFNAVSGDFQKAGLLNPLTQQLPGQAPSGVSQQQLIAAEVAGNADAIQAVQREADRRKAAFGDGGSAATTSQGVVGLAPTNV